MSGTLKRNQTTPIHAQSMDFYNTASGQISKIARIRDEADIVFHIDAFKHVSVD